uniref:Ig-like domain-containing protein n=1 Tax=Xiphophorus couchianus TaxID=32473 RepID=A0A3B5L3X7_9TELE
SFLLLSSFNIIYIYVYIHYEDFYQVKACCSFNGPNFDKIEYILTASFNKQKMLEYNSTRGNWIGFTDYSIVASTFWNKDPLDRLERAMEIKLMCFDNRAFIQTISKRNLSTTPTMRIKSVKQPDGRHPAVLVCSAYNFYPKQIQITWLRNDQEVTEGVSNIDVIPDGELYYQFHSYLEYTPTSGERISCMVEHVTLSEIIVWNNSLPEGEKTTIVVGLCGLIIGLVIFISGFIYHKKKGRISF